LDENILVATREKTEQPEGILDLRLLTSAHWDDQACRGRALSAEFDPSDMDILPRQAVRTYEQAVEPFLKTDRLSDTERAMLMGGACAKAYGWAPKNS
jgi:hypothetical protein